MRRFVAAMTVCMLLSACGGAKQTELPTDLSELDRVKPQIEKLEAEERELLANYVVRHTLGAAFSGGEAGIPAGTTIGDAIDAQRKFEAEQRVEEAKQQAIREKLLAEREAALKKMRDAVTVTLVSKDIKGEYGYSGIELDQHLRVTFGYTNNTEKEIAGVKGYISVRDLFGDELSGFLISNDETIKAGETATWTGSRSIKYAVGDNQDRKLAELPDDKYKVVWEPRIIVFADGSRIEAPEN